MSKDSDKGAKSQSSARSKEGKGKDEKGKAQATPQLPAKVSKRPYSIVVWGASGFTGELLCEQITQKYPVRVNVKSAPVDQGRVKKLAQRLNAP